MDIWLENEELALILDVLDRRDNYLGCEIQNTTSPSQRQQINNEMKDIENLLNKLERNIKWK
jgi:hypothetical protein